MGRGPTLTRGICKEYSGGLPPLTTPFDGAGENIIEEVQRIILSMKQSPIITLDEILIIMKTTIV
jgi:hypothetical protein